MPHGHPRVVAALQHMFLGAAVARPASAAGSARGAAPGVLRHGARGQTTGAARVSALRGAERDRAHVDVGTTGPATR